MAMAVSFPPPTSSRGLTGGSTGDRMEGEVLSAAPPDLFVEQLGIPSDRAFAGEWFSSAARGAMRQWTKAGPERCSQPLWNAEHLLLWTLLPLCPGAM